MILGTHKMKRSFVNKKMHNLESQTLFAGSSHMKTKNAKYLSLCPRAMNIGVQNHKGRSTLSTCFVQNKLTPTGTDLCSYLMM